LTTAKYEPARVGGATQTLRRADTTPEERRRTMTALLTIQWRRIAYAMFTLASMAVLLYTIGAPMTEGS
jgi:hypothetical protein